MSEKQAGPAHTNGALNAERCVVELERGREINLHDDTTPTCTARLVETLNQTDFDKILSSGNCQLVLSRARAQALEHNCTERAALLKLPESFTLADVHSICGLTTMRSTTKLRTLWQPDVSAAAEAALNLAQQAAVLPALLINTRPVNGSNPLGINVQDAASYRHKPGELTELSRAHIPLEIAESVELVVFRERHGSAEHVAITVGKPDRTAPMIVRLHSSCFTGDILGSMRCDCGEQLQGAIASMAKAGGGIVLYVSQEGRGIGLASKLRAYQLQDAGLDTIEANQNLGFEADERRYHAASTMLQALEVDKVRLMTNNPLKIEALRKEGINVVGRLPSIATVNAHNARYLETKRTRAGHMLMESAS